MQRLLTAILRSLGTVGALVLPGLGILSVKDAMAGILNVPSTYSNIQTALNAAVNGDVILVDPGVYTQNLTFGNKQVALRSIAGPASTIIHVAGGVGVQLGGNSELTGFTITGAVSDFGAGVVVSGTGTLIKGNVFDGNVETSGGFGAAIGGNGASPVIDGNVFRNNSSDFQFLSGVVSFVNSSSPLIENNIFEDNPSRAVNLTLPADSSPRVINNTFVRDTVAVRVDRRVNSIKNEFRNNIIAGNGVGLEVDFGDESLNPTWTNNLVFGNTTNYQLISNQTGMNGNISVGPMFISSTNLHVLAGSPTINVGSPLHAPNHDFDGNFRPIGAGFDLGAYEFVTEPSSITLTATGLVGLGLLACRYRALRRPRQSL
jgi:hypothetical protein